MWNKYSNLSRKKPIRHPKVLKELAGWNWNYIMDEEMWREEWPVTGSDKGLVGEIEREMNMDERDLRIDPTTASEQPHTESPYKSITTAPNP
jgi:hypothetical protein